jgi:predicted transcriptional regulator
MKKSQNLYPVTSIRLRPDEKAKLERLAKSRNVTMTQWVREAIREAKE